MDLNKFADWLKFELKARGWHQIDLVRKSGLSTGQISRLLDGERCIREKSIIAIAHALKLPPLQVFIASGLIPEIELDQWMETMTILLNHVSRHDRVAVEKSLQTSPEIGGEMTTPQNRLSGFGGKLNDVLRTKNDSNTKLSNCCGIL